MKEYKNSVDVYMASLWRGGHAIISMKTLMRQPEFATATISCNNYTDEQWEIINEKLNDPRITLHRTDNKKESNEKLKFIHTGTNPYICLADDDLIYPPNYLNYLIRGCEKYQAHVSLHGTILGKEKLQSYYKNRQKVFMRSQNIENDEEVDITSNCGSLFKRSFYNDLDKWYDFCGNRSMDDLYVNYFAKKKGIKRMVLAHKKGYLNHKAILSSDNYVFDKYVNNDKEQTDFINNYFND